MCLTPQEKYANIRIRKMAQFVMTVNLDNDASDQTDQALARIIAEVCKKIGDGLRDGSLRDITSISIYTKYSNGNNSTSLNDKGQFNG